MLRIAVCPWLWNREKLPDRQTSGGARPRRDCGELCPLEAILPSIGAHYLSNLGFSTSRN